MLVLSGFGIGCRCIIGKTSGSSVPESGKLIHYWK
jgi:hypothetical protein